MADKNDSNVKNNPSLWRFPAEFESQDAVWLGWLSKEYVAGYQTDDVMKEIVSELVPNVKVVICVPDETERNM